MKHKFILPAFLTLAILLAATAIGRAQTTAFTYQGSLRQNGATPTGNFDFQFGLFVNSSGGTATATITNLGVAVNNGLFTTTLDFGNAFNGTPFWLDIAIRTNGSAGAFSDLTSRQALTATPYALYAPNAGTVTGVLAVSNLPASVALLNSSPVFTGTVTAAGFTGDGSGLTNLSSVPTAAGYLFAYDLTTQAFPGNSIYQPIHFSVPAAQLNGWALSGIGPGSSTFTASNSGLYLFQYDAAITGTNGRNASLEATLNNNVQIPGSQGTVTLTSTNTSAVVTLNRSFLAQVNSNDVFKLQFTADNTGVNLTTSGANNVTTNRPSIALTIIKIN